MSALCVALLVCACGGETPVPPDAATVRAARGDAVWYLHVHLGEGTMSVRTTQGGSSPRWSTPAGPYAFTIDDPEGSMKAIKALHVELMSVTASDSVHPGIKSDGTEVDPGALLVSAGQTALWRYAQWVIATGSSPMFRVHSFLGPDSARWVDVDLRHSRGEATPGPTRRVTVLTARLFRDNLDRSREEQFTKIRLGRDEQEVTSLLGVVPRHTEAGPPSSSQIAVALPRAHGTAEEHTSAWRLVEEQVAKLIEDRSTWIGELRTPFPKGLAVPYADVVTMLEVFQRLGCDRLWIEGAPPPRLRTEGGGWEFNDGK